MKMMLGRSAAAVRGASRMPSSMINSAMAGRRRVVMRQMVAGRGGSLRNFEERNVYVFDEIGAEILWEVLIMKE